MSEAKGKFIVIEGVDGAGKSTQAYLLSKYLAEQKLRVVPTREPGGTGIGERVRDVLLDPHGEELSPHCELLLYMASRAQLVWEIVRPSLERGYIVVSERYIWSSLAYQGYAGGLRTEDIEAIGQFATQGLEPDLTIVLDIDPEIAVRREKVTSGGGDVGYDRIEKKGLEFQKKVRQGFLDIARHHPDKIKVIEAAGNPRQVLEQMKKLVASVVS